MEKKGARRGRSGARGTRMALIAIGAVALLMFFSGGLKVYRPSAQNRAEIEANVQALASLEAQTPVDLDAAESARRKAELEARGGIMVDDLAAEQQRILNLQPGSKSDLIRWFENAAIVGDSVVDDIVNYGWLRAPIYAKIGIRAASDLDVLDGVEAARPQVIFLYFGMNDMEVYGSRVDIFTERYTAMVRRLHISLPDSVIYINAIFPCADRVLSSKDYYRHRDTYNAALQEICRAERAYYVDASFILENKPELINNDGIHMKRSFYPYWLCYLADIAGLSDNGN